MTKRQKRVFILGGGAALGQGVAEGEPEGQLGGAHLDGRDLIRGGRARRGSSPPRRPVGGHPGDDLGQDVVPAWFGQEEVLGVEGGTAPPATEPAVEQRSVGVVVGDAVAGGVDDEQRNVQPAQAPPQRGDHASDLQQAAGRQRLRPEGVGLDPGQDLGIAGEEPVLLGDPEAPPRRHQRGGGDGQLLRRGVVGGDVEARRHHDERRHAGGPLQGGTERHVGAEAVPEQVDGGLGVLGPGEVHDPSHFVEPRPVAVDVATPARRRPRAPPLDGVHRQAPLDQPVRRFGEPLGVALQAVHHDEGGHGGRVPPGVAVNRRLPAVQLERPGPL